MPFVALSAVLLAVGSTGGAQSRVTPDISFEKRSWGAIIEKWSLTGRDVLWEKPVQPGFTGGAVTVDVKKFALTKAQIAELRKALVKADKSISLPDECTNYIPDGPYGQLVWSKDGAERALKFTASCMAGPNSDKADAALKANRIVQEAGKTVPVAEQVVRD